LSLAVLGFVVVAVMPASAATAPVTASATSALDSSIKITGSARCPRGRTAVGVAATTTRPWTVHIIGLVPDGRQATATARVFSGAGYRWQVTVTAICASIPTGLQYLSSTTPMTPVIPDEPLVAAKTICPANKRLIGFGGMVAGGRIATFMPNNNPDSRIFVAGKPFTARPGP
jgi:hypothetical protein